LKAGRPEGAGGGDRVGQVAAEGLGFNRDVRVWGGAGARVVIGGLSCSHSSTSDVPESPDLSDHSQKTGKCEGQAK